MRLGWSSCSVCGLEWSRGLMSPGAPTVSVGHIPSRTVSDHMRGAREMPVAHLMRETAAMWHEVIGYVAESCHRDRPDSG